MNRLFNLLPNYFSLTDDRGSIVGLINTGAWKEINIITSERGTTRGGHYHKETYECFVVLEGTVLVNFRRPIESNKWELDGNLFCKGDVFVVPPFVEHTFNVQERAVWINLLSLPMCSLNPDFHKYHEFE